MLLPPFHSLASGLFRSFFFSAKCVKWGDWNANVANDARGVNAANMTSSFGSVRSFLNLIFGFFCFF
jgi:hypothetical protein